MDKCKTTKILWERLKKFYGNELTTEELTCEGKMRNTSHVDEDDEDRSASSCNIDEKGTHLFIAQESEEEDHTCESVRENRSHWQDVFGSDDEGEEDKENISSHQDLVENEGEEEDEAKVDLEGELVNALKELNRFRREYKLFKNTAIVE